jgi:hypothetical protein
MPLLARAAAMLGVAVALIAASVLPANADAPTPVDPADVASLTITPGDQTVVAGDWVYTTAVAYDQNGVSLGDVTTQSTIVDSVTGEQDPTRPWDVRPITLGLHTITYTFGSITASIALTVEPGGLQSVVLKGFPAEPVTAGSTITLKAEGYDAWMHDLGDYTSQVSFRLENAAANESVSGNSTHVTVAGARFVDAVLPNFSHIGSATFTVVHAAAVSGSYNWGALPDDSYVGVAYSYPVQSLDAYGNTVARVSAKLKSSHTADHISGSKVTFVNKSARTITATIGSTHLSVRRDAVQDSVVSEFLFVGVAAGHAPHVTVRMVAGDSGVQPTGTVRVYYYNHKAAHVDVHVTSNRVYTVPMPKLTAAGSWESTAVFLGSNAYVKAELSGDFLSHDGSSVTEHVSPGAPTHIVLSHSGNAYAAPTEFSTFGADRYGNHSGPIDDAVLSASGGAKVHGDTVTFPKAGKFTIRSRAGGFSAAKSVTVIRSASFVEFAPVSPVVSGTAGTVQVYVSSVAEPAIIASGHVVLHYGTKTITGSVVVVDGIGTVTFTLPVLPRGSYALYATYVGNGGLYSGRTGHTTLRVVAAA